MQKLLNPKYFASRAAKNERFQRIPHHLEEKLKIREI